MTHEMEGDSHDSQGQGMENVGMGTRHGYIQGGPIGLYTGNESIIYAILEMPY